MKATPIYIWYDSKKNKIIEWGWDIAQVCFEANRGNTHKHVKLIQVSPDFKSGRMININNETLEFIGEL